MIIGQNIPLVTLWFWAWRPIKTSADAQHRLWPNRSMVLFRQPALQLGAHMVICLDFPMLPPQSFYVFFILFVVIFVIRACRNRFTHFHAELILFPVLTAHFYFLFLISMLSLFEVGTAHWAFIDKFQVI